MKKTLRKQRLKSCSFMPKTNRRKGHRKRSLKLFLKD